MGKSLEYLAAGMLGLATIVHGCAAVPVHQQQTQIQREIKRWPLENRLLELMEGSDFDLAEAAIIACEVKDEAELNDYLEKFEKIVSAAASNPRVKSSTNDKEKADAIFDYLWDSACPDRYKDNERDFKKVIDNQLNGKVQVGNCMGLTVLMDAVCQRLGVEIKSRRAYNHIYSSLDYNGKTINIENTVKGGFDYEKKVERTPLENKELIVDLMRNISHSRDRTEKEKTIAGLYIAAKINPEEADLFYLTMLTRNEYSPDKERELLEELHQRFPNSSRVKQYLSFALESTSPKRALELYKEIYPTLYQRNAFDTYKMGIMHVAADEYSEALPFLEEALEMDPNNSLYIRRIVEVKKKLGMVK